MALRRFHFLNPMIHSQTLKGGLGHRLVKIGFATRLLGPALPNDSSEIHSCFSWESGWNWWPCTKTWGSLLGTGCFRDYIVSTGVSPEHCFWHSVGPGKKTAYITSHSKLCHKHEWVNCISGSCKVSLLVVHHIAFHGLEPLSRQKSASQKDFFVCRSCSFVVRISCNVRELSYYLSNEG